MPSIPGVGLSRGTLRVILGRYLDRPATEIAFTHNAHGRPEVVLPGEPPLRFNVTHTGDVALIAVTRLPTIGVDIERYRKETRLTELAERYFAPAEVAAWRELPDELRTPGFFHIWTQKEAYVKAHGRGLTYPLDLFVVESDPRLPARLHATLDDPTEAACWRMETLACPAGYAAALAGPVGDWRVVPCDFATSHDRS
ncbi:MAG: 4'-phosphopantetheinyl transferase superfamily protein [Pirellulales bacterium]